ncbi:hypothetical protein [Lysinibacillus sp. fls2-241-R2A-57]|nr:hypothetical protein [Lysinibacillus sp. fls2-241-R2A-57]
MIGKALAVHCRSNKDEQLQAHWVRDGIEAEDIGQIITLPNF